MRPRALLRVGNAIQHQSIKMVYPLRCKKGVWPACGSPAIILFPDGQLGF
jgi:hypothetical protein